MLPVNSHIMLIDDNEDILLMIETMLKLKGYKVSVIKNCDDIEMQVDRLKPDVILMDMLLRGYDGRDICKKFKANPAFAAIPIIMLSAHPNGKRDCLQAGANFFLEKPFDKEHLFTILRNEC